MFILIRNATFICQITGIFRLTFLSFNAFLCSIVAVIAAHPVATKIINWEILTQNGVKQLSLSAYLNLKSEFYLDKNITPLRKKQFSC